MGQSLAANQNYPHMVLVTRSPSGHKDEPKFSLGQAINQNWQCVQDNTRAKHSKGLIE